jgi:hypothetical protein
MALILKTFFDSIFLCFGWDFSIERRLFLARKLHENSMG